MALSSVTPTEALRSKGRIEIPLRTWPRYVPGSGPPPPAISLLPIADSTCYIVNKLALPPVATLGVNERRLLYYTISWTDLPAARVPIPCTQALKYVSPREIEEWEYNDLLRREEEARQEASAEAKAGTGKRRRSKPPRARLEDVAPSAPILEPEEEALILQKKAAGPSLSTPQKRKWEDILQDETDEAGDNEPDADAIFRQLNGQGEEGFTDELLDSDEVDMVSLENSSAGQLSMGVDSSAEGDWSRASSLRPPQAPAPAPVPQPSWSNAPRPSMAVSPRAHPPSSGSTPLAKDQPQHGGTAEQKSLVNAFDHLRYPPPKNSHPPSQNGHPASQSLEQANGMSSQHQRPSGFTPVPVVKRGGSPFSGGIAQPTPSPSASNFADAVGDRPASSHAAPVQKEKRKRKRKPKVEEPVEEPVEEEGAYEVKNLLGDKEYYDETGRWVRYFKVLWVGDWPDWQNPSWEPQENISEELVLEYLKKKEAKAMKRKSGYPNTDTRKRKLPSPWMPRRRYSNVAEAFEGAINEAEADDAQDQDAGDEGGEGELFLVTEDRE